MKSIISQLKHFISLYSIAHWLILLLFCGLSVYCNYGLKMYKTIQSIDDPLKEFLSYCILYGVHTVAAYFLYSIFSGEFGYWKKPGFILLLLLSLAIFSFRAVTWQHSLLIKEWSSEETYAINRIVFNDLFRLLYLILPVFCIWLTIDRKNMPFYGISLKQHNTKVYVWLLLFMIPLIVGASMLSDFLDYYPRFRKLHNIQASYSEIIVYELCYGLDFTSIELFFRGFMVMAFIRYVGIHAVLPMAAFYLSIHYGKPMGEAISSFFGGTILGVISFYSRSIFGGIMVHVGIAWLMELGAWIGNLIRGSW